MRIGTDEWVSEADARTEHYTGLTAPVRRSWARVPSAGRLGLLVVLAAALPLLTESGFVLRVGINALLFVLLALGLNVVVGYAGLLDLGYVAFYGFGAYTYALLSSEQLGIHLPTELTILVVIIASAGLGYLLGLPSRRLLGDYLAIVTLFFGQAFVEFVTNADRLALPLVGAQNVTGGPNGITNVDRMTLLGIELRSLSAYYYVALGAAVLIILALSNLADSRTGRAWRAVREDPLAAEAMTIPVNRVKLFAFAVGGATAGFTGTIFAAVQQGVFPANFEVLLLIMIYAAVVLGGAGSLPGVVLGAVIIAVLPEVLREPDLARLLFLGVVAVGLVALVRPWWRLLAVSVGTLAVGLAMRPVAVALWPDLVAAPPPAAGPVTRLAGQWVVLVPGQTVVANAAFLLLLAAGLLLVSARPAVRWWSLPPVLYLAAFVWENRLVAEGSITRQLLLGGLLVLMMNVRPHGLLGQPRKEIV
jgi:branched-chain amino acid transport system permease protein